MYNTKMIIKVGENFCHKFHVIFFVVVLELLNEIIS